MQSLPFEIFEYVSLYLPLKGVLSLRLCGKWMRDEIDISAYVWKHMASLHPDLDLDLYHLFIEESQGKLNHKDIFIETLYCQVPRIVERMTGNPAMILVQKNHFCCLEGRKIGVRQDGMPLIQQFNGPTACIVPLPKKAKSVIVEESKMFDGVSTETTSFDFPIIAPNGAVISMIHMARASRIQEARTVVEDVGVYHITYRLPDLNRLRIPMIQFVLKNCHYDGWIQSRVNQNHYYIYFTRRRKLQYYFNKEGGRLTQNHSRLYYRLHKAPFYVKKIRSRSNGEMRLVKYGNGLPCLYTQPSP